VNKKVAISQSNYIPWKGYFDMIAAVDEFIIYDDMQYTKRDWRNRNQIKTPQGVHWLTVPVEVKGKYLQSVKNTQIVDFHWAEVHWKKLEMNYRKSRFFDEISSWLKPLYFNKKYTHITEVNLAFIKAVCEYLLIPTVITYSWDYSLIEGKSERLADLCVQAGASEYISGPAANNYIDETVFTESGIGLSWFDYSGYIEYSQLWGDFTHSVSILDMLFNCGKDSHRYMKYVRS
jgi:hypothetical protein